MSTLEIIYFAVSGLLGLLLTVVWSMFVDLKRSAKETAEKLGLLELQVARERANYATMEMMNTVFRKFDKLHEDLQGFYNDMRDRIDHKADKGHP